MKTELSLLVCSPFEVRQPFTRLCSWLLLRLRQRSKVTEFELEAPSASSSNFASAPADNVFFLFVFFFVCHFVCIGWK